jgi:transposase
MITYEQWQLIREKAGVHGLSAAQIAAQMHLTPRTVRHWLQEPYRLRKLSPRSSQLDPFKGRIMGWLQQHPYSAVQIHGRLRQEGFNGGITIVKDYIQQVRPRHQEAFLTLSFQPGECAQVDWGSWEMIDVENIRRRLSFFAMVLGYSRMLYVEFSLSQSQEHFLTAHRNAFEFFGGVPAKVMVDNCKTAVISHAFGMPPEFNTRYIDFARHYGFEVRACNVRKANEKGIVENAVGYIKGNFLKGRPVTTFAPLQPAVRIWLDETANVRIHARTRKRPVELFVAEQAALKPLPVHPYDCASIRSVRVDRQFRVRFDGNRYSVPAKHAGGKLLLKACADSIRLYQGEALVAEHARRYGRGMDIEDIEHAKPVIERKRRAEARTLIRHFLELSPNAVIFYRELNKRQLTPTLHVRRIMALVDIHGPDEVRRAIDDAIEFRAFASEYIAHLLEQRRRRRPEPGPLHLSRKTDLLELRMPEPDLSIYEINPEAQPKGQTND